MTFIEPNVDTAFFLLRIVVAIIFLAHGPGKLQNTKAEAEAMGLRSTMTMLVGALETLGAASLILGLWVQASALVLAGIMIGAIYFKTQKWDKNFTGPGGWEFDFLLLAASLAIALGAPTTYSLL